MYPAACSFWNSTNTSLEDSRASRIVWVLEVLELDYEFKTYARDRNMLAPKELKKLWPIGLFPLLQVFKQGLSESETVAESGHIVSYLARNYDHKKQLVTKTPEDTELADYYLHFAEGSLQPHLVSMLVNRIAVQSVYWPVSVLVGAVTLQMNSKYYGARLKSALEFLDSQLEKKGGGYFVGDSLTVADLILDFPINQNIFGTGPVGGAGRELNAIQAYPHLYKWHQLTTSLPSHIRAMAREKTEVAKL